MKKTKVHDPLSALSLGNFTHQLRFLTSLLKYKAVGTLSVDGLKIIDRPSYAMAEINRAFKTLPIQLGKKKWKDSTLMGLRDQATKWMDVCPWPVVEINLRDNVIPAIEGALDRHPAAYKQRGKKNDSKDKRKREKIIFNGWQNFKANNGRSKAVYAHENNYTLAEVERAINTHEHRIKRSDPARNRI